MRYLSNYSRFSKIYENENQEGNENQDGKTELTGSEAQSVQNAIEDTLAELPEGDSEVAQILGENSSFRRRGRFSRIYERFEQDEMVKIPTEEDMKSQVEKFSKAVDDYIKNKQWGAIFELPKDVVVQEASDISGKEIPGSILTFKQGVKLELTNTNKIFHDTTPALAVKYEVVGERNGTVYTENDSVRSFCFVKYQLTEEEEEHVKKLFGDFGKKLEANYKEALAEHKRKKGMGLATVLGGFGTFLGAVVACAAGVIAAPAIAMALVLGGLATAGVGSLMSENEVELKYAEEVLDKFKFLAVYLKSVLEPQGKKVTDLVLKNIMDIIENGAEFKGI